MGIIGKGGKHMRLGIQKHCIEYVESSIRLLVFRYPNDQGMIVKGTKLIVRNGQEAVLVHNGQITDIFGPGEYYLRKEVTPGLARIAGAFGKTGGIIKTDVYFVNMTTFLNKGWGTQSPVICRDPELGVVRMTAFGSFSYQVTDVEKLMTEIIGSRRFSTASEVDSHISLAISECAAETLSMSQWPLLDLSMHYRDIAASVKQGMIFKMQNLGISLVDLSVESINTTSEVTKTMDEYASFNLVKNDMDEFAQFQAMKAMREAASTPGNATAVEVGEILGKKIAKIVDND